jgi:hypothetical protein
MIVPTAGMVYDVDQKTGRYVIGKERLEDYAQMFLSKYWVDALKTPMPLPIENILEFMGLKLQEAKLSPNNDVFGCCFLLDGAVDIFDDETNSPTKTAFLEKTILIDPGSMSAMGEGAKRNTLIHEAIHWHKDKTFFDVLRLKQKGSGDVFTPILCKQSKIYNEPPENSRKLDADLQWIEWQANRLAPRVLMPFHMFRNKAIEIIEKTIKYQDNPWPCDSIINELSLFFIVSRSSVKYRLLEVGLKSMIEDLADFDTIYADVIDEKETSIFEKLSVLEAYQLLEEDQRLRAWVDAGSFVFVEGYFIKNSKEFIVLEEDGSLALTTKAQQNLKKCAINIVSRTFKNYPNFDKDILKYSYLARQIGVADKRIAIFDPKLQSRLEYDLDSAYSGAAEDLTNGYEDEIEIARIISDPTKSLCQCLWGIMEYRKWRYPKTFTENTLLYDDLFGRIRRDDQNTMSKETLLAICIGLKLKLFHVEELMEKRGISLKRFDFIDYVYMRIFERFPGISIHDFNRMLEMKNIEPLGTK